MEILEAASSISLKNVLLATDLSPSSEKALLYARALSREHGSHVYTVHVSAPDDYQLLCPEAFADTFNELTDDGMPGSSILRSLLRGLQRQVPVHGHHIWEIVGDVALRNDIDLLIVGTHGRTGVPKLLFGSVAEEVFREVSCPVLTVGSHAKAPRKGLEISKVLLATDGSPTSLAPAYAAGLCEKFRSELTVLSVGGAAPANHFVLRQQLKDRLTAAAPHLFSLDPKPMWVLENGDPPEQILRVATALDADLIVLGARHRRDVRSAAHFPWATASRVIAAAPCPVLTIRDVKASSAEEVLIPETYNLIGR